MKQQPSASPEAGLRFAAFWVGVGGRVQGWGGFFVLFFPLGELAGGIHAWTDCLVLKQSGYCCSTFPTKIKPFAGYSQKPGEVFESLTPEPRCSVATGQERSNCWTKDRVLHLLQAVTLLA